MNRACCSAELVRAQDNHIISNYSYQDLCDISAGIGPIAGFPKLPKPGMLMLDRISQIDQHGGRFGKGCVMAELDILSDQWFFQYHFENDPVMPGSLGVDGLCQVVGFYLGWIGFRGKGRAIGVGKTRFKNEVTPDSRRLQYRVDIKTVRGGEFPFAIADGVILCHNEIVTEVSGIRVGIKPEHAL